MKHKKHYLIFILLVSLALIAATSAPVAQQQSDDPPDEVVKLIFIHHSTGKNWLNDGYGDLGRTLGENNYFVSDTNYGWGPNNIGDRTDIPNWKEWFVSDNSPIYMDALFNETEQHASYTRTLSDPGGENAIIMFKSCFPNSALDGNISDPPTSDGWLTMGNSKYVYNTILEYFATRPDKLFIVITAPPLSDPTYADNARAFNNWLKNEWLANYEGSNVAVFDFYDVLTGPGGGNTLYYPTGDDHPSAEGSRIATAEFLPVLNTAYNRWQAGDASAPPADPEPASAAETESQPEAESPAPSPASNLIDSFEGDMPYSWNAYHEDPETSMTCAPSMDVSNYGAYALRLDYSISPYAWGTCHLEFDAPQNWSGAESISFYAYAQQEITPFNIDLFVEGESYIYQGWVEGSGSWQEYTVFWDEFLRVDWEENAGAPFDKPERITGLAFGFSTPDDEDGTLSGTLYIDDVTIGAPIGMGEEDSLPSAADVPDVEEPTIPESGLPALPCAGGLVLPAALGGWVLKRKKK